MKGCIGIIANLDSKRLLNKHLIKVNGQPILKYLIDRIKNEFKNEINDKNLNLMILTGSKKKNISLGLLAEETKVKVFFGNDINIPCRINEALVHNNFDFFISVDGDDILCSVSGMRRIYDKIMSKSSEYVKTRGYPFGMNSFGIESKFIKKCLKKKLNQILETGWTAVFDKEKKCDFVDDYYDWDKRLRFTLDYPEDLKFFEAIINSPINIISAQHKEFVDYVLKNKIYNYNAGVIKKYWKNFNEKSKINEEKK